MIQCNGHLDEEIAELEKHLAPKRRIMDCMLNRRQHSSYLL